MTATPANGSTSPTPEDAAAAGDVVAEASAGPTPDAAPAKPKKRKAHIHHRVPGRIRMKVPAAKQDPAILEVYREAFLHIPGIIAVKTKPETGSIVIHYDPAREQEFERHFQRHTDEHLALSRSPPKDEIAEIAGKIEEEAEFLAQRSELARHTVDFFKNFNRELKVATDNTVDLKIVLAGGLAAFTFLEIGAEAATPMWVTLALFTLNELVELRSHEFQSAGAAHS